MKRKRIVDKVRVIVEKNKNERRKGGKDNKRRNNERNNKEKTKKSRENGIGKRKSERCGKKKRK